MHLQTQYTHRTHIIVHTLFLLFSLTLELHIDIIRTNQCRENVLMTPFVITTIHEAIYSNKIHFNE